MVYTDRIQVELLINILISFLWHDKNYLTNDFEKVNTAVSSSILYSIEIY